MLRAMAKFARLWLFALVAAAACSVIACSSLKIAAFNVQVFGPKKFSDREVISILTTVRGGFISICVFVLRRSTHSFVCERNGFGLGSSVSELPVRYVKQKAGECRHDYYKFRS